MAAKNTTDPLVEGFKELKLAGMAATVTTRLTQAAGGELGYRELVQALIDDQREHRDATAIARRQRAAQFEDPGMLEDFDYGFSPERRKVAGLIRDLTQIEGWQPTGRSIILHGPTGTGKSRVAQGLGQIAIRRGMDVRFAPTSTLLEQLAQARDKGMAEWARKTATLVKPAVLVLDAFAARSYASAETLDLYELITRRHGKSMIVTSGCNPKEWYPLFENKALGEQFLDRLLNTSHHILMDGPSYRTKQRPGRAGAAPAQGAQKSKRVA